MAELSTLGAVIKTAYEGQADTNPFTDAEAAKVARLPDAAGTTGQVLKSDGTKFVLGADTNTTYTLMTEAEMVTGTAATGRLIGATTAPAVIMAAIARDAAIVALTPVAGDDATDGETAATLANECKAALNAIIAALKS